jgi:hypothetical protein
MNRNVKGSKGALFYVGFQMVFIGLPPVVHFSKGVTEHERSIVLSHSTIKLVYSQQHHNNRNAHMGVG